LPSGPGLPALTLQHHPHRPKTLKHHDKTLTALINPTSFPNKIIQNKTNQHEIFKKHPNFQKYIKK
jgi:hypothetical protein